MSPFAATEHYNPRFTVVKEGRTTRCRLKKLIDFDGEYTTMSVQDSAEVSILGLAAALKNKAGAPSCLNNNT